jgi:hypothetical protein
VRKYSRYNLFHFFLPFRIERGWEVIGKAGGHFLINYSDDRVEHAFLVAANDETVGTLPKVSLKDGVHSSNSLYSVRTIPLFFRRKDFSLSTQHYDAKTTEHSNSTHDFTSGIESLVSTSVSPPSTIND